MTCDCVSSIIGFCIRCVPNESFSFQKCLGGNNYGQPCSFHNIMSFHLFLFAESIEVSLLQNLPDAKKSSIAVELQKLVSEWPLEVIKRQKEEDRKVYNFVFHAVTLLKKKKSSFLC